MRSTIVREPNTVLVMRKKSYYKESLSRKHFWWNLKRWILNGMTVIKQRFWHAVFTLMIKGTTLCSPGSCQMVHVVVMEKRQIRAAQGGVASHTRQRDVANRSGWLIAGRLRKYPRSVSITVNEFFDQISRRLRASAVSTRASLRSTTCHL